MNKLYRTFKALLSVAIVAAMTACVEEKTPVRNGELWYDDAGEIINAHGGGILTYGDTYYWFGEAKNDSNSLALHGVSCYSSRDLRTWHNEGIALPVSDDEQSDIASGCILERPKVIYNALTGKFVMFFHLELRGQGYNAARTGIAVSDTPIGPYTFIRSLRPNANLLPENLNLILDSGEWLRTASDLQPWSEQWVAAVKDGMFTYRDLSSGQMSRDMTLYVDADGRAYHIYSSEENLTLQIACLTDDYTDYTGRYVRVAPAGHNEAPALFHHNGKYYMITSGCTGWAPNAARLLVADSIMGEWTLLGNPCRGADAELTYHSQSTYILPVAGKKGNERFIFMADRWKPEQHTHSTYVWLPVRFDENGIPYLRWQDNREE